MPAKKSPTKKSTAKSSRKKSGARTGIQPLYAVPIYAAAARGNVPEMKKMAAQARKHISDVIAAVSALEKSIKKG
jgi:hypothetical protein